MVIGKTKNHFFVGRRNVNLVNMSWLSKIHILRCSAGLIETTATYLNDTLYCLPAPSEYLRSSQHAILNTDVWYYLFSSMVCISLLLNSVHVCVVFHLLMRYIEYQDGFCIVGLLLHWIYRVSLQL